MKDLTPIAISTYARKEHFQKTIESLQNNYLADKSELFIFSDAPKKGDENKVERLREYLDSLTGFKKITVFKRKNNSRIRNNRNGIRYLLENYGKCIFLEEDVVTAPGFLKFMNEALEFYKDLPGVFSITGYCPPIKVPKSYPKDVFFLQRFNAWGLGIWKEEYNKINYIDTEEYNNLIRNKSKVKEFKRKAGEDVINKISQDVYGEIDALDVKAMYYQLMNDKYTVYPSDSLTKNIGTDGTGTHSRDVNKFEVSLSDKTSFSFTSEISSEKRIERSNYKFRRIPIKRKIGKLLKRLGLYNKIKKVKFLM